MNVEILKNVRKLIVHGPCADGRASALILRDALPEREILHVQYSTPEHKALVPEPGVLFCDFSPWVERVEGQMTAAGRELAQRWVDAGAIVLDHHTGTADLVAMFGERGVFADVKTGPGVSGAMLAFREVWQPLEERAGAPTCDGSYGPDGAVEVGAPRCSQPIVYRCVCSRCERESEGGDESEVFLSCAAHVRRVASGHAQIRFRDVIWTKYVPRHPPPTTAARLLAHFAAVAGVRDTWQTKDSRWQEACAQAAALMFWEWDDLARYGVRALLYEPGVDPVPEALRVGPALLKSQHEHDSRTIEEAHRFSVGDLRVVCFLGHSRNASDIAERLNDQADLVLAIHYFVREGQPFARVSCRSRGIFSAKRLAMAYGGNGHEQAAAFSVEATGTASPYALTEFLVRRHVSNL
jgi:hypothetical protein